MPKMVLTDQLAAVATVVAAEEPREGRATEEASVAADVRFPVAARGWAFDYRELEVKTLGYGTGAAEVVLKGELFD